MEVRAREAVARLWGATVARVTTMRGRRANGVNPDPSRSIYRGSTRCGSFCRTMRFNGSILINLREDCAGFIINRLSHDLKSEFRSSAVNQISSGHLMTNKFNKPPHHINLGL
jgi:hypothetical protein